MAERMGTRASPVAAVEPGAQPPIVGGNGRANVRLYGVKEIHGSASNPRLIKSDRFKNLCLSLARDPGLLWRRSILAQGDGEIYAGNRRRDAVEWLWEHGSGDKRYDWQANALAAGIHPGTVPAVVEWVDPIVAKERAIIDNQEWGEWNDDALAEYLYELEQAGSPVELLGFNPDELAALREMSGSNGDTLEAETPEETQAEPISQPGTLWLLGDKHRLLCGDASKREDVERLMNGQKADMVLTDPPYGMDLDTDWSDLQGAAGSIGAQHGISGNKYAPVIGDDAPYDPAPIFAWFSYCKEVFLWGADYYANRIPHADTGSWLVWDKRKDSQADAIGSEFELCWSKGKHKRRILRHEWFGFASNESASEARNRKHPNQKPTALMANIMQQWGKQNDLVVDLYAGSGSVLLAAAQHARRCYSMELLPHYCDVVVQRFAALTGQDAIREDGVSWATLLAEREAMGAGSTDDLQQGTG